MNDPSLLRCSDAARARFDPLIGTAPPARRWLLLEHLGPWRIDAVAGSGIEPVVLAALTDAAQRSGTRILLVRRPGRSERQAERHWILASLDGATVRGRWAVDQDLLTAAAAMGSAPPLRQDASTPIILVCAHGVHDVCCAVRGRPVAAALAQRWPEAVWECSHVGGDRFAPNVVLLPDGYYYGDLDPESAVRTVAQHLAGTVGTQFLRGMARYPPPAQAAVATAYERFGPLPPHAIRVTALQHRPPGADHASHTTVELVVPGVAAPLRLEVLGRRRAEAQLTCRAARETPATEYQVRDLEPHRRDD